MIYKIPRIQLGDLKSRDEMKQSGIYFLFGRDEDKQKNVTYIGQATTRKMVKGYCCEFKSIPVILMQIILMMS